MTDLKECYSAIPSFTCKPGCTDCCGPVPFAKVEWDAVIDRRQGMSINCPYSEGGNCAIYSQRPLICRLFGASDEPRLQCPHGCKPDKPLTVAETRAIMAEYMKLF